MLFNREVRRLGGEGGGGRGGQGPKREGKGLSVKGHVYKIHNAKNGQKIEQEASV